MWVENSVKYRKPDAPQPTQLPAKHKNCLSQWRGEPSMWRQWVDLLGPKLWSSRIEKIHIYHWIQAWWWFQDHPVDSVYQRLQQAPYPVTSEIWLLPNKSLLRHGLGSTSQLALTAAILLRSDTSLYGKRKGVFSSFLIKNSCIRSSEKYAWVEKSVCNEFLYIELGRPSLTSSIATDYLNIHILK